ncbi:MAG: lectin-like protein [Christensenellales bacterium]
MKQKLKALIAFAAMLVMLVSVMPLQAALADTGSTQDDYSVDVQQSNESKDESEDRSSENAVVSPCLTPSYTPSSPYRSSAYYTQLCNVTLTGNQRTDLVNVARSQLGYHEGNSFSDLGGGNSSGSSNYTEYGYWYGTQVAGSSGGYYYAWCAYFISWCARQAGIPTSIISNASYACAGSDNGDFKNLTYYPRGSYTPQAGDLIFFDWNSVSGQWDHVEVVTAVSSSSVTTLGGNTGTNNVKERTWSLSYSEIQGYGVPNYSGSSGGGGGSSDATDPNNYPTPPTGTYLNVGDSGNYVKWLQACLCQLGYTVDVDGQFGNQTASSLSSFQSAQGLTVDGGFGPECRTRILQLLTVATPTISAAIETGKATVTISCATGGATIYYTTDGSAPTSSSTKYTGAFTLTSSATVKAIAIKQCRFNSAVASSGITVPTVIEPGKPEIYAIGLGQSVWVQWTPTENTHHYEVRFIEEGSSVWYTRISNVTGTYCSCDLPVGRYYVRVIAFNSDESVGTFSSDSEVFTVTDITDSDWTPGESVTFNGHTYILYDHSAGSWQEAEEFCERNGGHLVTITSAEEQQIVSDLAKTSIKHSCWIGCTDAESEGSWNWITEEEFSAYQNWEEDEPNDNFGIEDYAVMNISNGEWNDIPVLTDSYAICFILEIDSAFYSVTFTDWDGTVLSTQQVLHGSAATAPANPTREGYTFVGWDKPFDCITADTVVTAVYEQDEIPENAVRFETETVRAQPGGSVSVDFNIDGEYEGHTITAYIHYDPTKLTLAQGGLERGEIWTQMLLNGGTVISDTTTVSGRIGLIAIMPGEAFSGSGTIFTMNFNVAEDVELDTTIPITIEIVQFTNYPSGGVETPIPYYTVSGAVEIPSFTIGDINNDGIINASDAIMVMRHALGSSILTGTALLAADVDGNGSVTASDALAIMRIAIGMM